MIVNKMLYNIIMLSKEVKCAGISFFLCINAYSEGLNPNSKRSSSAVILLFISMGLLFKKTNFLFSVDRYQK